MKTTLKEIIYRLKINEFSMIISSTAAPFLILYSLHNFIGFSKNTFEFILTLTVSFTLILILIIFVTRQLISTRKEKYANITEKHHSCFHIARDIQSFLNEFNLQTLNDKDKEHVFFVTTIGLIKILDNVATMYSMLTGTRCRAAIKTIYQKEDKLFVRTLARDTASYEKNFEKDKQRFKENIDSIEENEDFQLLYEENIPGQNYFFCNNLIKRKNYKTSSFKLYGNPNQTWYEKSFCKGWTLPYRSTIVWPIQQKKNTYFHFKEIGCIGFLSIDSESRGVFKKNWDTWLGGGISDAVFHPINTLFNLVETK